MVCYATHARSSSGLESTTYQTRPVFCSLQNLDAIYVNVLIWNTAGQDGETRSQANLFSSALSGTGETALVTLFWSPGGLSGDSLVGLKCIHRKKAPQNATHVSSVMKCSPLQHERPCNDARIYRRLGSMNVFAATKTTAPTRSLAFSSASSLCIRKPYSLGRFRSYGKVRDSQLLLGTESDSPNIDHGEPQLFSRRDSQRAAPPNFQGCHCLHASSWYLIYLDRCSVHTANRRD